MTVNKLKLNHNKAGFFIIGTIQRLTKLPPVKLNVDNDMMKPSTSVRNLGITFDNHMSITSFTPSIAQVQPYTAAPKAYTHRCLVHKHNFQYDVGCQPHRHERFRCLMHAQCFLTFLDII